MAELTGPVQLLAVGFPAGARFEGRIADELDKLESVGSIRILDFVFLHRDEMTGALVRMDYRGGEDEGHVTTMLEGAGGDAADWPQGAGARSGSRPATSARPPTRSTPGRPPPSSSSSTSGPAASSGRSWTSAACRSRRAS